MSLAIHCQLHLALRGHRDMSTGSESGLRVLSVPSSLYGPTRVSFCLVIVGV